MAGREKRYVPPQGLANLRIDKYGQNTHYEVVQGAFSQPQECLKEQIIQARCTSSGMVAQNRGSLCGSRA
jgi:hypothetical protein